ncbi:MAG: protein-S-isoprenylcysteine methyltransferase [Ramlibacter sp.]|jgi:protein-S-isoprenylcysteine O-methyltransferase Ste14|nr:protein-S-isoprenylcysteine methyltransferase [Ramlibacter sp.]
MNSLELRIPPPVVALFFALLMWLASLPFALPIPFAYRVGVAIALVIVGLGLRVSGMVSFRRARTTMNPVRPGATSLVRSGVYRLTRNPMYLGWTLKLLGWAMFLASPLALLLVPLFMLYIRRFQIEPEERVLSSLFVGEYSQYSEKVRRWL